MSDQDILNKTAKISEQALTRIGKEQLLPTPENYELFYVYYAGSNPDITRAIDLLKEKSQNPTQEQCTELYLRFLSNSKESDTVRQAGNRIQETIQSVSASVTNVKTATSQYSHALEDAKDQLETNGELSKENLQSVLNNVMTNTKDVLAQNQKLEEELNKSTNVMDELRRDLETVRKEAFTDSLTSLSNRKSFDAEMERILAESKEKQTPFCLLMMDIDHFKTFNDNYGHQVGDQVLRLVARTLTNGVKGRDIAARYGGEEFAIILPDTELAGGLKVGDMLRGAISKKDVVNTATGEKMGNITISGGVAEYTPDESVDDITARADSALYTAKHNGRNQIAAATSPKTQAAKG